MRGSNGRSRTASDAILRGSSPAVGSITPTPIPAGESVHARATKSPQSEEMEPLRVVALAYHFAPANDSASIRNTKILRHLTRFSLHLDLITVGTRYLLSGPNQALLDQVPADVNVVRTRCVYPHRWPIRLKSLAVAPVRVEGHEAGSASAKGARKNPWQMFKDLVSYALMVPDKYVGWYPFALWAAYRQMRRNKSDVIYAVGQPWTAFFVGYTLKLLSGKPLVIDFMDPWASRSHEWDHDKPKAVGRIAARLESFIVRRADFIVANTEELAEDFRTRFQLPSQKVAVITCGFDPADFKGLPAKQGGEAFVITHTGSCYGLRSPLNLLRAVKTLIDGGRIPPDAIRLNFIGHLPVHEPALRALLADPVVEKVVNIESWVPHATALEYLSRSDVLLVLQPGLRLVVPAKLYEYAAIGRPILALAELNGAVARVVRQAKLGVTVNNDDVHGIEREVERLFLEFRQGRLRAAYTPSDIADYRVDNLAAALSSILHQVRRPA
jgi:glycosyltransferase involved in cell wall biosynthesis